MLTPAMLVSGLVVLVIIAFVGYIGFQLLIYAKTTPITLTNPTNVVSQVNAQSIVLAGTASRARRSSSRDPAARPTTPLPTSMAPGRARSIWAWAAMISASCPSTRYPAPLRPAIGADDQRANAAVICERQSLGVGGFAGSAQPQPGGTDAGRDGHRWPRDRTRQHERRAPDHQQYVPGHVQLDAHAERPADCQPQPEPRSPSASGSPAPIGPAREVIVSPDGNFAEQLDFPFGRWQLTITVYSSGLDPVTRCATSWSGRRSRIAQPAAAGRGPTRHLCASWPTAQGPRLQRRDAPRRATRSTSPPATRSASTPPMPARCTSLSTRWTWAPWAAMARPETG